MPLDEVLTAALARRWRLTCSDETRMQAAREQRKTERQEARDQRRAEAQETVASAKQLKAYIKEHRKERIASSRAFTCFPT